MPLEVEDDPSGRPIPTPDIEVLARECVDVFIINLLTPFEDRSLVKEEGDQRRLRRANSSERKQFEDAVENALKDTNTSPFYRQLVAQHATEFYPFGCSSVQVIEGIAEATTDINLRFGYLGAFGEDAPNIERNVFKRMHPGPEKINEAPFNRIDWIAWEAYLAAPPSEDTGR